MQRSAWRPDRVGQDVGPAVVEQDQVEGLRPVAWRHTRPHRRVRVHPLRGRRARQQLEEDLEIAPGRDELLDAHDRDEDLGQGQAHPPVALRLERRRPCRSRRRRSSRPRHGDPCAQELLAQVQPGRLGELLRVVGQAGRVPGGRRRPSRRRRCPGSRSDCGGSPGPGCAMAGRGRAGRSSRRGRSPRRRSPSRRSASLSSISWVAIDLTLTTSVASCCADDRRRRSRWPRRRRAPSGPCRRRPSRHARAVRAAPAGRAAPRP